LNPTDKKLSCLKTGSCKESVKDRNTWLGDREYQILTFLFENGLVKFKLSTLWKELGLDRRRVHDVIKRLESRGIVRKVEYTETITLRSGETVKRRKKARGWYEIVHDLTKLITKPVRNLTGKLRKKVSQGQAQGTRVSYHELLPKPVGLFFDNVKGYLKFSGRYVPGDKGFVRRYEDLALFESISYSEIQYQVKGIAFPRNARIMIYTNYDQGEFDRLRVEFRPQKGFIKRHGVAAGVRLYWELWLGAVKALLVMIGDAPMHVLERFIYWLTYSGVGSFISGLVCK